jgi:hypothetical protein
MIAAYGAVAVIVAFVGTPVTLFMLGGCFGFLAGLLQFAALRQKPNEFVRAADAFAVRRVLAASTWGKAYLVVFWVSGIVSLAAAAYFDQGRLLIGWAAAYSSFGLVRDLITLSATFWLQRYASTAEPQTI